MKFSLYMIMGLAIASQAMAADRCATWAGYMTDMFVPPIMSGTYAAGFGGSGLGFGMNIGVGIGIGTFVPPLTDEVKSNFKGDRKAIQAKYDQYILAQNELMGEMGASWAAVAKLQAENPGVPRPWTPLDQKINDLAKKVSARADAFKKEMFAYGNRNNCMHDFDVAMQKRQFDEMQATWKYNQKVLEDREKTIANLQTANTKAMSALEDCKSAAPSIAVKLQKQIDGITRQLDKQDTSASGGFGYGYGGFSAK